MQKGLHGLTAAERFWLQTICRIGSQCGQDGNLSIPGEVIDTLTAKRLIEPVGSAYQVTSAGLAEAIRTSQP